MASNGLMSDAIVNAIKEQKNNIAITKLASLTTSSHRKNPTMKMKLGMRCRINGVDNLTLNIIPQGTSLPYTNTVQTQTALDDQKTIVCDIVYGNSEMADDNESLLKIELDGLPKGKAGEVKFETKVTIDTNGYMHVEYVCTNNGMAKEAVYIDQDLINYN